MKIQSTIRNIKKLKRVLLILIALSFLQNIYGQTEGKFYATFYDYAKNLPISGYTISNQEYTWSLFAGEKFLVSKDGLPAKLTKISTFPYEFFTVGSFFVQMRDKKCYIVVSYGKLCFYSLYSEQQTFYYSETLNGDLKKFDEKTLEPILEQHGLLEKYISDKPKPNSGEITNDFFNRQVQWHKKYFDLLNQKIK